MSPAHRYPLALLAAGTLALVVSAIHPFEFGTWVMEVFPIFIAVPILLATGRRFPLSSLAYTLIFVHASILMTGGHYTYARVPLGFWMEHAFGFARNHYDRIGHLMQGIGPAIVARELLLRTSPLEPGKWLFTIVVFTILGVSATYEFIEWWAALASEEASAAFLGTQGDPWDSQWDMFLAGCGAIASQFVFGRLHDRQLAAVDPSVARKLSPRP